MATQTKSLLLNYTPHPITIYSSDGTEVLQTIQSSGLIRLESDVQYIYPGATAKYGIEIYSPQSFKRLTGLPETPDVDVIVSMPVAQFILQKGHTGVGHVFTPDTGAGAVRDEKGNILGTKRLTMYR